MEGYSQVEGSQEEILNRRKSWEYVTEAADHDKVLNNDEYPSVCSYSDDVDNDDDDDNHDVDDSNDDECVENVDSEIDKDSCIMEDDILETLEAILNGDKLCYADDTSAVSSDPVQYCEYVIDCIISDAVDISQCFDSNQCELGYQNRSFKNDQNTDDEEESDSQITTELSEDRIFDDSFGESIDDEDDDDEYLEERSYNCIKEENAQDESSLFDGTEWYLEYLQGKR